MLTKDQIISFYTLYSKELLKYLHKLTGDTAVSEDLLHDVFEHLITYSAKRDIEKKTVRAFLYRISHNLAVNYLKRKKRKNFVRIDDSMDFLAQENDTEKVIVRISNDELNRKIYAILEAFDPVDRSIFILHKENGRTYEEIAAELKISARTVRRKAKKIIDTVIEIAQKEGFF